MIPSFEADLLQASVSFDHQLDRSLSELLKKTGSTVAVSESMTGGLISARLTALQGASGYFLGGLVCYSSLIKVTWGRVSAHTIRHYGVVSPEVASEMAKGIQIVMKSTIGLSITGYAGPDDNPDQTGKVCIGVWMPPFVDETAVFKLVGSRDDIRQRATQVALFQLKKWVEIYQDSLQIKTKEATNYDR